MRSSKIRCSRLIAPAKPPGPVWVRIRFRFGILQGNDIAGMLMNNQARTMHLPLSLRQD